MNIENTSISDELQELYRRHLTYSSTAFYSKSSRYGSPPVFSVDEGNIRLTLAVYNFYRYKGLPMDADIEQGIAKKILDAAEMMDLSDSLLLKKLCTMPNVDRSVADAVGQLSFYNDASSASVDSSKLRTVFYQFYNVLQLFPSSQNLANAIALRVVEAEKVYTDIVYISRYLDIRTTEFVKAALKNLYEDELQKGLHIDEFLRLVIAALGLCSYGDPLIDTIATRLNSLDDATRLSLAGNSLYSSITANRLLKDKLTEPSDPLVDQYMDEFKTLVQNSASDAVSKILYLLEHYKKADARRVLYEPLAVEIVAGEYRYGESFATMWMPVKTHQKMFIVMSGAYSQFFSQHQDWFIDVAGSGSFPQYEVNEKLFRLGQILLSFANEAVSAGISGSSSFKRQCETFLRTQIRSLYNRKFINSEEAYLRYFGLSAS